MACKIFLMLSLTTLAYTSKAETVHIGVAANFAKPMSEITTHFEKRYGHQILISIASSGKLFAQIHQGAPFDILLSADMEIPSKLAGKGLALSNSQFTYATGRLILWSSTLDILNEAASPLRTLSYNKLAIANPKLAPFGQAAIEVLDKLNMTSEVQTKLVFGDNISQTFQFVSSGNADIGFVALSQVWNDGEITSGAGWLVPQALYSPIRQDAVLLERGQNNPAAIEFLAFLKSNEVQKIIERYGYTTQHDPR